MPSRLIISADHFTDIFQFRLLISMQAVSDINNFIYKYGLEYQVGYLDLGGYGLHKIELKTHFSLMDSRVQNKHN